MTQLTLNLIQGAVSFNFSVSAAEELKQALADLLQSLKAIASRQTSSGKPVKHKEMEYRHTGDVFLEIFCNPNIYPSPFAAKVLITLRDERIRLTAEAELTRLIEDLNQYLGQN